MSYETLRFEIDHGVGCITLDPNRKGSPCFVDDGMIAFGARFNQRAEPKDVGSALTFLVVMLGETIKIDGRNIPPTARVENLTITPVSPEFWHKNVDKEGSLPPG